MLGEIAHMEILLRESEALSLPCFDLVPAAEGEEVSAYWRGRRSDLPERFPEGVTAYELPEALSLC